MPLPQCVIGSGGERTRIAIDRYFLRCVFDINDESYVKEWNELYRRQMALGCPFCGNPKRFGVGPCRRCYRLRPRLREAELIVGTSVSYPISKAQSELQAFARRLANNKLLSPSEKLKALLRWKPEDFQT